MISKKALLFALWFLHVASILMFMYGFFPIKSFLPEFSYNDHLPLEPGMQKSLEPEVKPKIDGKRPFLDHELYSPLIGKTVLIVIDALRADFMFDEKQVENMPFVKQLLATGEGRRFVAKAHPPTVTLPRIKALTTGSIPGYIDVILNFDSPQLVEDNLITEAAQFGSKIVFYGDETWMKLFPRHFLRSEGTTSFFVTDFTEVDDNVTRHLDVELNNSDWDILILHYLGLDHIGHVSGPRSPLVGPKLREMDGIVNLIYKTLTKENSLESNNKPPMIVICGDHGMSDAGSHGGASVSEIKIPIVFLSPLMKLNPTIGNQEEVLQIDLVSSLSVLLGLPIPKNNIGKLILPIFDFLDWRRKLYFAFVNTRQLMDVAKQYLSMDSDANLASYHFLTSKHKEWLLNNCSSRIEAVDCKHSQIMSNYSNLMDALTKTVASKSTNYNTPAMLMAILIHWLILLIGIIFLMKQLNFHSSQTAFLCGTLICHALSLASSSFVEEEHQTWYSLTSAAFVLLLFTVFGKGKQVDIKILGTIFIHRICRNWNSTGDKWAHLYDIGDWLNSSDNHLWLSLTCICSLIFLVFLRGRHNKSLPNCVFLAIIAISIYTYRAKAGFLYLPGISTSSFLSAVILAKVTYSLIGIFLFSNCLKRRTSSIKKFNAILTSWLFLSALVLRPHNLGLIALMALNQEMFADIASEAKLTVVQSTFLTLFLAQCSFFQQGNSNSLARIDLAGGYVGLNTYNPAFVGILLTLSTYAGPLSWLLNLSVILFRRNPRTFKESQMLSCFLLLLSRTLPWAFYCVVAFVLRYHLFVWTVFSPKLLYEGALSAVLLFCVGYFQLVANLKR